MQAHFLTSPCSRRERARMMDGVRHQIVTRQSAERELVLSQIEKKGNQAYDSLSDSERVWYTTTRLIFCIRDGGLPI
jgi:hypothetical protein